MSGLEDRQHAAITREAACQCGQLRVTTTGESLAVSICHCLACQRRTGSAFGMQARFKAGQEQVTGRYSDFSHISDEADRKEHVGHFCPDCGSQVFESVPSEPDIVFVSVGAFADASFPPPAESRYDSRRHPWVGLPESVQRWSPEVWETVRPLYDARQYEEAAGPRSRAHRGVPGQPNVYFNVACCESLSGRTKDAIERLRQAIAVWEGCREMARGDTDFEPIRDEPAFIELVSR